MTALSCGVFAPDTRPPNLVLILADDLGFSDVGFSGSRRHRTPNIDRFAASATVFDQTYAPCTNCAPSRAAILSGQVSIRTGVYTVNSSARNRDERRKMEPVPNTRTLDPTIVTVAGALRAAGYRTASIGKWHLGSGPLYEPTAGGFDVNVAGSALGRPRRYQSPYEMPGLPDGPPGEHLTARLTDEAIRFVEESKDAPFFLYMSTYAVHAPIEPSREALARVAARTPGLAEPAHRYAALVEDLDIGVGRLLAALDRLGLADDTVVVFTSDNGGETEYTTNRYLRDGKGSFYEGGLRVPFAVRWPGHVTAGRRSAVPISLLDVYPTFAELAGAAVPDGHALDGVSLVPLFTRQVAPPRDALFWHFPAYLGARGGGWRTTPVGVIRSGDLKLIEWFETGAVELYDLSTDAPERHDLAAERPDDVRELLARLREWRAALSAPMPVEKPEHAADAPRPNVLLIVADELSVGDVGGGDENVDTPHLDRLAAGGMRFTRHYAGNAWDVSSSEVLLTATHSGHGFFRRAGAAAGSRDDPALPARAITLAERMAQRRYTSEFIGRWNLGDPRTTGGPRWQGYQRFIGVTEPADDHPETVWMNEARTALPENADGAVGVASWDLFTDRAVDFLSSDRERAPFVLHLAVAAPLAELDRAVGRLMTALDDDALTEETLVVLTAARGRAPVDADSAGSAESLSEARLRVPFIAHWPSRIAAGSAIAAPSAAQDVVPTLIELAGGACGADVDGVSLASTLLGRPDASPPRAPLYFELGSTQAIVSGDWKLVRTTDELGAMRAVLFDLATDPTESADVAADHPAEVARLVESCRVARRPSPRSPSVFDDGR